MNRPRTILSKAEGLRFARQTFACRAEKTTGSSSTNGVHTLILYAKAAADRFRPRRSAVGAAMHRTRRLDSFNVSGVRQGRSAR